MSFENTVAIKLQARSYISEIVERFTKEEARRLAGLACEVALDEGVLYLHACTEDEDTGQWWEEWSLTYIEQQVQGVDDPRWYAEFNALVSRWSSEMEEYSAIQAALDSIVTGVSTALVELELDGFLQSVGFVQQPCLAVFTLDDEDREKGLWRVAQIKDPNATYTPVEQEPVWRYLDNPNELLAQARSLMSDLGDPTLSSEVKCLFALEAYTLLCEAQRHQPESRRINGMIRGLEARFPDDIANLQTLCEKCQRHSYSIRFTGEGDNRRRTYQCIICGSTAR